PQIIPHPFLAVCGGIQPDVLPLLSNEQGREDGLIHRILFGFPAPFPLTVTDDEVNENVNADYVTLFERLWNLRWVSEPKIVRLTDAAKAVFTEFCKKHYAEQEADDFPSVLRGPFAKFEAYCARLGLILHCCRRVMEETVNEDVDGDSVTAAWKFIDYFKSHTRKV